MKKFSNLISILNEQATTPLDKNDDEFVYKNKKLYNFCNLIRNIINKRTKLNLLINGSFIKCNGKVAVRMYDKSSDKNIIFVPVDRDFVFGELLYYKTNDFKTADLKVSSANVSVTNFIKMFCDLISTETDLKGGLNEAYNVNLGKLIVTPGSEKYAEAILKIKPGQVGTNVNKKWEGNWTQELISMIQNGVNIFDIAMSVDTQGESSPYWKYFGGKPKKMGVDNRDTLLVYLARKAGIQLNTNEKTNIEDSIYTDDDDWYQRVCGMSKEEANEVVEAFDDACKELDDSIDDFVEFYKAKGADKIEVLKAIKPLTIVPGKGGIGKTTRVEKALARHNMRRNIDYVTLSSAASDADSLYNFCYDNNGKIIVLDDIPSMFDASTQKTSFWKNIISGSMGKYGVVAAPARQSSTSGEGTRYYNINKYGDDNRARYYAEAGGTPNTSALKKLKMDLDSKDPITVNRAKKQLEEMELSSQHLLKPSEFTFTGCIIALTNSSMKQMKENLKSPASWEAIKSRSLIIELNPPGWAIWLKVKDQLLKEKEDTSIPDECTLIPRDMTDEYINYVEHVISDGEHNNFNFRITEQIGPRMRRGKKWKFIVDSQARSVEQSLGE